MLLNQSLNLINYKGYCLFDLYGDNSADFANMASLWTIQSPLSNTVSRINSCGARTLMGGSALLGPNTIMERTYDSLPPHSYISYVFKAASIGHWISSSDSITVNIDDRAIVMHPNTDLTASGSSICGISPYDYYDYDIVGVQPHSSGSLTLKYVISNSGYASSSYGIFDLSVLIRTASPYSTLKICYNTKYQFVAPCNANGDVYKDKSGTAHMCDSSCNRCFGPGPNNCFGCESGYSFNGTSCFLCDTSCLFCNGPSKNQCTRCKNGYFLQLDNNTCTSFCSKPYIEDSIGTFQVCSAPCKPIESVFYDRFTKKFSCQLNSLPSTTIVSGTQGLKITNTVITRTLLLLTSASSGLLLWGCLSDMLKYIRYLDIDYSRKLRQIFDMNSLSEMIIGAMPSLNELVVSKFTDSPLPTRFQEYGEHSSFLASSWEWLAILVFVAIIVAISNMLVLLEKPKFIRVVGIRTKAIFQWNYCISTFISYLGNLVFNSSLQLLTASYTKSGLAIASLVICVCVNIAALIFFGKVIAVIRASRQHFRSLPAETQSTPVVTPCNTQFGIILEDYKTHSWLQQSYFALLIIRIYIFNTVIVYLYAYPAIQGVIISALALFMLLYLALVLPMKKKLDQAQSIFQELVILTVNICVTILAFFDKKGVHSYERGMVEDVIIWSNVVFFAFCFICMNIATAQQIKRVYLLLRTWYRRRNCIAPERKENVQSPAEVSDLKALNQSSIIEPSPITFISYRRTEAKVNPLRSSPKRRHNQLNQHHFNDNNLEMTSNHSSLKNLRSDDSGLKLSRENAGMININFAHPQRSINKNSEGKSDGRKGQVGEKITENKWKAQKRNSLEKKMREYWEKVKGWNSHADSALQQKNEMSRNSKNDKHAHRIQRLDMIVEDMDNNKGTESINSRTAQRVVQRQEMDRKAQKEERNMSNDKLQDLQFRKRDAFPQNKIV